VHPFDPKSYLGEVLAPYRDSTELPSLFERYLLDFGDADDSAIEARLEEVKRYWDKQSEHPRYGAMVRGLIEKHAEARLTLADADERARAVAEARSRQQEATERKQRERERWERLLRQSVEAAGGLDPARRVQLEKVGRRAGIAEEELKAALDAVPEVAEPEVLDPALRSGIVSNLATLARILEEPRAGLSLFHALALDLSADSGQVRARREAESSENNKRPEGNLKSAWDRVLSQVKLHLLDADPSAYVNGLVADVREALEQAAFEAIADDNVIDEVEAEDLRRQAIELGLSADLAERVVADLAREHGAIVRSGEAVDLVACPACNHLHRRDVGAEHCASCGTALFIKCPDCGERGDATASRCASCGTDLHGYAAAGRTLARLPDLVAAGKVAQAQEELEGVIRVRGSSRAEVAEAASTVRSAVERARRAWAEVEAARADRRQYAARRLLSGLVREAGDFPNDSRELAVEALADVERRITEAETLLQQALKGGADRREAALVEVLRLATDCAEAERELDKLPPQPPGAPSAASSGDAVVVRWEPSPTAGVGYAVTRVALPAGVESRLGDTDELQWEDRAAPPGSLVRYRVAATRGRASSAPLDSEALVAAFDVRDLAASPGDGKVDLTWAPVGERGRVVVERRKEGELTPVLIAPDLAGACDRDVVNGCRYSYRVFVEYPDPVGGVARTSGRTVFAQPVEKPRAPQGLRIRSGPERVEIEFDQPSGGSVLVFRCEEEPDLPPGVELDPGRLAELGVQLAVQGSTAIDREPLRGRCYYLPVATAGNVAVPGVAAAHVSLPAVENTQVVSRGREALVTWSWPEGITIARVAWRHDRRPEGPEDAAAERMEYRLGAYRDNGGFSLATGAHRSLFVAVFPAARVDGEIICGSAGGRGSWATLRSEQKTEVRYTVRRVGGLRKRLEVEVSEPAEGDLPELVLVGREGSILPRNPSDGEVLARIGGSGPRSSSLEMRRLSRPLAVKLFLGSAAAGASHVLYDPMVDDLLIG
jgi:hypothetical protein